LEGKLGSFLALLDEPNWQNRDTYLKAFSRCAFTYVGGFSELLDRFVLVHAGLFDRVTVRELLIGWRRPALDGALAEWMAELEHQDLNWSRMNRIQLDKACHHEPLCLDRALLVAKALALAFGNARHPDLHRLDISRFVQLRPAIYRFASLATASANWLKHRHDEEGHRGLVSELTTGIAEAQTEARALLVEVANGALITRANAVVIQDHMQQAGFADASFSMLPARKRGLGPCRFERPFVCLAKDRSQELTDFKGAPTAPSPEVGTARLPLPRSRGEDAPEHQSAL
jgi:hypothetical protein